MASNKLFVLLTLIWTFIILFLSLSSLEGVKVSINVSDFDKLAHFLMYSIYAILIVFSFKNGADKKLKFYFFVFLYLFIFGFFIEILQGTLTKSRSQDMKDVLANGFGALIGLFFAYLLSRSLKKRIKL